MSRVPWQSRIFDVDPGSFNNYENVLFFGYFLFFVKIFDFIRTNWYYMLKGISKSYPPWKNEYIWMCGSENIEYGCHPDWRVFSVLWMIHYFNEKSSNETCAFYPWKWKFKGSSNLPRKPQVKILPRSWFIIRGIEYYSPLQWSI